MKLLERLNTKLEPLNIVEARPTQSIEIINKIANSGVFAKTVSIYSLADGATGLFGTPDGQAYEVIVRPAVHAQFRNLYPGSRSVISRRKLKSESIA